MVDFEINEGLGKTNVTLSIVYMGNDIVVTIFNENAHIGAVALAEYSFNEQRTSVSVVTRLGHKDDVIAQKTAHAITKETKKPSCVISGIHVDEINESEILEIEHNSDILISRLMEFLTDEKPLIGK